MDLSEIPLFSELNHEDIEKITSISRQVSYKKDEYIFHEGDAFQGLFIVLKGSVKIFKISPHGKEYILHLLRENQLFGDVPLFTGGDCPASVQVLEDTRLLFIPKVEFLKLLENNSHLSMKVMAGFAKRLKSISVKAEDETLKEVVNRLADYLVKEAETTGTAPLHEPYVKLTLSNPTLAAYLGTITETISRAFRKMRDQGIIRIHERTVFIQDFAELKKLAE
ncbi:MAG TPA: Crp/Fnr family transcriptional regulator [Ignavibacteriales bacterium]|nr:Crp/Fnr family transcriptional regulator [Ignavibacteriales bacterium]